MNYFDLKTMEDDILNYLIELINFLFKRIFLDISKALFHKIFFTNLQKIVNVNNNLFTKQILYLFIFSRLISSYKHEKYFRTVAVY